MSINFEGVRTRNVNKRKKPPTVFLVLGKVFGVGFNVSPYFDFDRKNKYRMKYGFFRPAARQDHRHRSRLYGMAFDFNYY